MSVNTANGADPALDDVRDWYIAGRRTHNPFASDASLVERFDIWLAEFEAEIRADMQREVRTVEELDALPEGSIVRDRTGDTFSYRGGLWCSFETAKFGSEWIFRKWSPLTLVFTPVTPSTPNQQGAEQ